jgi:putative ABC transport system substrate-binding protein
MTIRRREVIVGAGSALILPFLIFSAAAQPVRRAQIGFISGLNQAAAGEFINALKEGLASLGYIEPSTLKLHLLFANYVRERIPALVEELQKSDVDLIITHGLATGEVVKSHRTLPVVYEFSADPVTLGYATDLAHPLYNATGITLMMAELNSKRLELLHEIMPDIKRIAVLANPLHSGMQLERTHSEVEGQKQGIEVLFFPASNRNELTRAFATISSSAPQAILVFSDAFMVQNRDDITDFAMRQRIPVISGWAVMADGGALFTYGPRLVESYRRVAYFADRILKGAKPADLPIEQPSVVELVINLKSGKSLGITIPSTVLARAARVIE